MSFESQLDMLSECVRDGIPFPTSGDDLFVRSRTNKLTNLLRDLRVRIALFKPPIELAAEMTPVTDLITAAHEHFNRTGGDPIKAYRLLYLLRSQWDWLTSELSADARRRLNHVWQVQLQPLVLRKRMERFMGLTFIPNQYQSEFPNTEFIDLHQVAALSLTMRSHRLREGTVVSMADIKVLTMEVDPDACILRVGGHKRDIYGQPTLSLCQMAKYYNYTPFHGAERNIIPLDHGVVVDGALALHQAMEWSLLNESGIATGPDFPEVYLGFSCDDDVEGEISEGLQSRAFAMVDHYVRSGRPQEWPNMPALVTVRNSLPFVRRDWYGYAKDLGPDAEFIQNLVYLSSQRRWEGLHLVPLRMFQPYSGQQPVRKAARILARFPRHLLGRSDIVGVAHADDRSRVFGYDGRIVVNNNLARSQVIRLRGENALCGSTLDGVDFDFESVPSGCERYFMDADRTPGSDTSSQV